MRVYAAMRSIRSVTLMLPVLLRHGAQTLRAYFCAVPRLRFITCHVFIDTFIDFLRLLLRDDAIYCLMPPPFRYLLFDVYAAACYDRCRPRCRRFMTRDSDAFIAPPLPRCHVYAMRLFDAAIALRRCRDAMCAASAFYDDEDARAQDGRC